MCDFNEKQESRKHGRPWDSVQDSGQFLIQNGFCKAKSKFLFSRTANDLLFQLTIKLTSVLKKLQFKVSMKKYYKHTSSLFIHIGPTVTQFSRPKSAFPTNQPELRVTLTEQNVVVLSLIFQRCHSAAVSEWQSFLCFLNPLDEPDCFQGLPRQLPSSCLYSTTSAEGPHGIHRRAEPLQETQTP